jgi:hypothetical protein
MIHLDPARDRDCQWIAELPQCGLPKGSFRLPYYAAIFDKGEAGTQDNRSSLLH